VIRIRRRTATGALPSAPAAIGRSAPQRPQAVAPGATAVPQYRQDPHAELGAAVSMRSAGARAAPFGVSYEPTRLERDGQAFFFGTAMLTRTFLVRV